MCMGQIFIEGNLADVFYSQTFDHIKIIKTIILTLREWLDII